MIDRFCLGIIMPLLGVALVLTLIRLLRGPHVADRVIALDLLVVVGMGMIVTAAIARKEPALLDVAVVLGLIGFLATVGFARYLEKRRR